MRSVPAMAGADYRGRSQLLFARLVADLQKVGDRDRGHDRCDEAGRARCHDEPGDIAGGDPLVQAEGADEELAHGVPEAGAAGALLELPGAGVALVLGGPGPKWRSHLVLRERAARLVGGDADQREVARRYLIRKA